MASAGERPQRRTAAAAVLLVCGVLLLLAACGQQQPPPPAASDAGGGAGGGPQTKKQHNSARPPWPCWPRRCVLLPLLWRPYCCRFSRAVAAPAAAAWTLPAAGSLGACYVVPPLRTVGGPSCAPSRARGADEPAGGEHLVVAEGAARLVLEAPWRQNLQRVMSTGDKVAELSASMPSTQFLRGARGRSLAFTTTSASASAPRSARPAAWAARRRARESASRRSDILPSLSLWSTP